MGGEASIVYTAVFSGDNWVSFSYKWLDADWFNSEAQCVAEGIKTYCFTVKAVDSDFAMLVLQTPNGSTIRSVVGNGESYGVENTAITDDWKPLIPNGNIDKLRGITEQHSAFVEDDLAELGGLLGISEFCMTADRDEFEDCENVLTLSFNRTEEKKKSFGVMFKEIFGEALEPLGFKLIKSRYPFFVRTATNGEIIHVITYMEAKASDHYEKNFIIYGGAATVYRKKIELDGKPPRNSNWYVNNWDIYNNLDIYEDHSARYGEISQFDYEAGSNRAMKEALVRALKCTEEFLLPALGKVNDLSGFIEFYWIYNPEVLWLYNDYKDILEGKTEPENDHEGLVLFKTCDTEDYSIMLKERRERCKVRSLHKTQTGKSGCTTEQIEEKFQSDKEIHNKLVLKFNELKNDPRYCDVVQKEMKCNKDYNVNYLRKIVLDI